MKKQIIPQIIIRFLFSLGIALWTTYLIGVVVLKMPLMFVLILACLAVVTVVMGTIIGIWILSKIANGGEV